MTKKVLYCIFFCLILLACKGNRRRLFAKNNQVYEPSFLNLKIILTDDENDVSFPIWFNDSMLRSLKIKKILRKSFPRSKDDSASQFQLSTTVPREIREYIFDGHGTIIQFNIHNYYDDREIGSTLFTYAGPKNKRGFSVVNKNGFVSKTTMSSTDEEEENANVEEREFDFRIHEQLKSYKNCLVYQDMETGDYTYFIPQQKQWGPLSVDSILRPNPKDMIVLGTPLRPIKKYQVSNKVNEKNVRSYTYQKSNSKVIANWVKKDYPFVYKRDFIYSKTGVCNGYIDSTFSEDNFVTRIVSEIKYNKEKLPISIIRKKENTTNETLFFSLDTFEYEK